MSERTRDTPAPGLTISQPRRGFRYGAEAFWVAGLALEVRPRARTVLDLGTGSGVIAALLAARGLHARGIDLRPEWAPLWAETLDSPALDGRLSLEGGDLLEVHGPHDLVVSNPPFFPRRGKVSPDPWKAAARTESTATLDDVVAAVARCLSPDGAGIVVVPVERGAEVRRSARVRGLGIPRAFQVGKRRWIGVLTHGGDQAPDVFVVEGGPEERRWYAASQGG